MEPANLNPSPDRDAELEALLRRAHPPLADDGFSARVVAALPARRHAGNHARLWWAAAGALAGAIFAVVQAVSGNGVSVQDGIAHFEQSLAALAPLTASPMLVYALLAAGLSLFYVFWPSARDRLMR